MSTGFFPGLKSGRRVTLTPHPFKYRGQERVELHLYYHYRPYDLYRTSVPVQYSYTSTTPIGRTNCTEPQCLYSIAIPLLPLLAVRPVQNLSACTVQLYLYSPYWPYDLYRTSVPVQESYTSTPPIGRRACTETSASRGSLLSASSDRRKGVLSVGYPNTKAISVRRTHRCWFQLPHSTWRRRQIYFRNAMFLLP